MSKTLFDKIWDSHVVATRADGSALLFVDRHLVHDGTAQAFDTIEEAGLPVRRPDLTLGTADHYVSTVGSSEQRPPHLNGMVLRLLANARTHGFEAFGSGDPRQGIVHVIGPELGFTLPGSLIVCGDQALLEGASEIEMTLKAIAEITAFEGRHLDAKPWLRITQKESRSTPQ